MTRASLPRHRAVAVVVALAVAGGCGGDDDATPEARDDQPGPGATTFVSGRFDELPLLPTMQPLGPIRRVDGVEARTYRIPGVFAEDALSMYGGILAGWVQATEYRQIGDDAFQAVWENDEYALVVTTSNAPTVGEEDPNLSEKQVQISLELYEPGTPPSTAPPL